MIRKYELYLVNQNNLNDSVALDKTQFMSLMNVTHEQCPNHYGASRSTLIQIG